MPTVSGTSECRTGRNRETKIAGPPRRRRYRSERSQFSSPIRRPRREWRIFGPRKRPSQNPMLSPMSAPITTATPGRRPPGATPRRSPAMITTVSPGTNRPISTLVSSMIAKPGEERPQHGVDALDGVEQPCEELVHAPSLERRRGPLAWDHVRRRSIAVPLRELAGSGIRLRRRAAPRRPHVVLAGCRTRRRRRAGAGSARASPSTIRSACGPCRADRRGRGAGVGRRALPRRLGRLARLRGCRGRARARPVSARRPGRAAASGGCACERFVAFDHARAPGVGGRARRRASDAFAERRSPRHGARRRPATRTGPWRVGRHAPGEYAALIERCRDAIREGDAYQLCLTTRFAVAASVDPIADLSRACAR